MLQLGQIVPIRYPGGLHVEQIECVERRHIEHGHALGRGAHCDGVPALRISMDSAKAAAGKASAARMTIIRMTSMKRL